MNTVPKKCIPILVQEFYTAYKGELKRHYAQGQLRRGGDPASSLTIWGIQVNISLLTSSQFLYGINFKKLLNIGKIDYHKEEMQKIMRKQLGSEHKMRHFRWIPGLIALNGKEVNWVLGGPGVTSNKIEKHTLNFKAKAC